MRRLTDVVEQGHERLFLICLVDKIAHEKMFARLNIPEDMLDAIKALYRMPMFQVSHNSHTSNRFAQRTGIRQGSPLSPFLFILTMRVMFSDVKDSIQDTNRRKTFQGINFQELLYADDTLTVAKKPKDCQ